MKYFIQLKDGIAFNFHSSSTEVDIPGDNIIEVESDGEKYLGKKYENDIFIDAPLIKYATLEDNVVVSINKTIYSSEVSGPIVDDTVKVMATWDGTNFHNPATILPVENSQVETVIVEPVVNDNPVVEPYTQSS